MNPTSKQTCALNNICLKQKLIKIRLGLFLLWWLCLIACASPKINIAQNIYDLNANIKETNIDKVGNTYILDNSNRITKYNSLLKPQYSYADNTLGAITTLDVSDPLKILIYNDDYGILIKLDNTLAELSRLNLYELDYQSVSVVATALDGNTWLYDEGKYQLKKINDQGTELLSSISMVDQGLQNMQPTFIQEKAGKLIMQDPKKGIFLFDNLGQFIQTFPFLVKSDVQFDGTNIIYMDQNEIVIYNTILYSEKKIPLQNDLVNNQLKQVILGKSKLYYVYNKGITILPYEIGKQ
jgi:hypothetical protein